MLKLVEGIGLFFSGVGITALGVAWMLRNSGCM